MNMTDLLIHASDISRQCKKTAWRSSTTLKKRKPLRGLKDKTTIFFEYEDIKFYKFIVVNVITKYYIFLVWTYQILQIHAYFFFAGQKAFFTGCWIVQQKTSYITSSYVTGPKLCTKTAQKDVFYIRTQTTSQPKCGYVILCSILWIPNYNIPFAPDFFPYLCHFRYVQKNGRNTCNLIQVCVWC